MAKTYSSNNLVVGVTYYTNRSNSVKKTCKKYELLLKNYIKYLNDLNEKGIVTGKTAEVLVLFIKQVESAKDLITDIGNDYSKKILSFLSDIDKADDKLFKNKGRKYLTDEEFNNARAVAKLELTLKSFFDGSWLNYKIWSGVAEKLVNQESQMMKRVKDLNEYTKRELSVIQGNCKAVDQKYSKQLMNVNKELNNYNSIIKKIALIASPNANNFNEKNISQLKKLIKEAKKFHREIVKNPEYEKISDDDVKYFSDNVVGYFSKSTNAIRAICEDSLANLFLTDFEKYRTTVNEAKTYFNSYSKDYVQSKEKFDAAKKQVDEMLDLYKKHGSSWIEYYADKEKAEMFNKILEKGGKLSKKSDTYKDIWYQFFFDMSESKDVLERFKQNCDMSNENVKKAIERIEKLYDKDVNAYLQESIEEFERSALKKGEKAAADSLVKALKSQNKIVGSLYEKVFDQAFAEMPAVAEYDWVESTNTTLNNAVEKLKKTSTDSSDYADRVKAVREAFDASKKEQMKFFKAMISNAKSETDKNYYQYCYDTIYNSSLNDLSSLDIMYESEYSGSNYNPLTDLNYDF